MTLVMLKILDRKFEIKYLPRKEMSELKLDFGTDNDFSKQALLSANYVDQGLIAINNSINKENTEEYIYKEAIDALYKMYFKGLFDDILHNEETVAKINVATAHEQNRIYNQIYN